MTDLEFAAWLADPKALPVTLINASAKVAGVDTPFYLSTAGYTTGAGQTPAHTPYLPIAAVGVKFTETLSLTSEGGLSSGDIEIYNVNGERDGWLGYVWANSPITAKIGDVRWPASDFRTIFSGIVADIDSKSRDKLSLKLRDKLQRLNTPATETKLGGTTPNKDEIIPIALGENHNITPLLTDPTVLEYQVHGGAIEDIIEVRDNAVPVSVTEYLSTGKFRLSQESKGTITVSVQGDKPSTYTNTISQLIQRLVTGYGKVSDRFTSTDLDTANLAAFDTAHSQPVGTYVGDRTNVLVVCQNLASSVGAQVVMSRLGLLRLIQLTLPAPGAVTDIPERWMVDRSLKIVERPPVQASIKIGFAKNWTVQENLQTTVPAQHKDLFATEWLTETSTDTTVQATYKLNADPAQIDTCLLRRTDATAEALRRRDLWKVQRAVYEFEASSECLMLELGSAVRIFNRRYGLSAGAEGIVVSLSPDWANRRSIVRVLV